MCHGEAVLPNTLEEIGTTAFDRCPEIKVIWIENSSLADRLKRSYSIMGVFSKKLTMVGNKLLWDLRKARNVVIPDGVREVEERWFMNSEIESVTIPASVTTIGNEAFRDCKRLLKVVFEKRSTAKTIRENAFWGCDKLTKVVLPEGLKIIRSYAFYCCKSLKTLKLQDGLEKIGVRCFAESGLEELIFPESTREVGTEAF